MTINGKSYSSPKNINLKSGLLRFNVTQASNPFGDVSYGLYVDANGDLVFRSTSTSVILGAAGGGGGSAPSLDAIFQGDQTLDLGALSTLTIDRSSSNNDVLTLTNTGAGSGDLLQFTNVGTGNDVEGTSDTWHFTKDGDMTANMAVFAGDAGSDSITLTAGDLLVSQGSIIITADDDNAVSLSVTNDTATTASVFVFAGSGAFTGTTTTSWMTITPSGLESGTAVYLPLAAITTGMGLEVAGGTTQTSGSLVSITSSATAATCTTGSMLEIVSGSTEGTSAVLVGISSAADDETKIMEIVASDVLATGSCLSISAVAMTTGFGISMIDLDALTTGIGVHIASSADALTTTGRLLYIAHSGATSTDGTLVEFITAATDETVILKLTSAAMIDGINLSIVGTTGMTTGSLIRATTSTAGAVATNGIVSIKGTGAHTSTSNAGLLDVGSSATTAGTVVHITSSSAGQTASQLLNVTASGYTTGYTGNVVQLTGCGTTGNANVLSVVGVNSTAGNAVLITSACTTTNGSALKILAEGLTSGVGIRFAHTTSVITDGGSMMRLSDSGVATGGATNGTILDIVNTGSVAGTLVKMTSNLASQTATCILEIEAAGYTTGFTGSVVKMIGVSTTGAGAVLTVTGANTTAGNTVKIDAAGVTTGTGLLVTSAGVIITTGELVSLVANGATTATAVLRLSATALTDGWCTVLTGGGNTITSSGGVLGIAMGAATAGTGILITSTGIYTGTTGLIDINAVETTTGTIIDIVNTGRTTGDVIKISTNTSGTGNYINCYDGAATDFKISRYGAVTIAGNAIGTASLTMNNGDLVVTNGNLVLTGGHIKNTPQAIINANTALSIVTLGTTIANNGASTHTLADGTVGQLKYVVITVYTDDAVITPNAFVGSTITLNQAGDSWLGVFVGTEWVTLALGGTAAVA